MRDQERLTRPAVVALPAEIDIANTECVSEQLPAAIASAVTAEMGLTLFCRPSGSRQPVAANKRLVSWAHKCPSPK